MIKQTLLKGLTGILAVIVLCSFLSVTGFLPQPSDAYMSAFFGTSESSEELDIRTVTETYPTDLILAGEDILFEYETPYRRVDCITEETLERKPELSYTVLVLNDRSGALKLSGDEIRLISRKICEDGFCLIYFGDQYADTWDERGEDIMEVSAPGSHGVSYFALFGEQKKCLGFWDAGGEEALKENPYILGTVALSTAADYLKEYNRLVEFMTERKKMNGSLNPL